MPTESEWLTKFRARWDEAKRKGAAGVLKQHTMRIELIARLSTIEFGKHAHPGQAVIVGDCVQAAKLTLAKDVPVVKDDGIPDSD